ncbi:hypothetical protein CDD80_5471 [Ophiocordyceps camponoti-rufipedis]|uniref:Uncharacterized protein n=1 Tax=Ophiocordyceps camponoti-rufipedis TaxID=2004952 RepID=A0A2C5YU87_9HYPO|nr:hypothetical protein CDD80_5471 [Ophiocordyceps camponoti-rufipedis]
MEVYLNKLKSNGLTAQGKVDFQFAYKHYKSETNKSKIATLIRLHSRPYPASRADKAFINATHDAFHEKDRMEGPRVPCPITSAVFVNRQTVKGVVKERHLVDLRPLNSVAIPDAYPMPLPSDMIHKLAGKRVISAIDAPLSRIGCCVNRVASPDGRLLYQPFTVDALVSSSLLSTTPTSPSELLAGIRMDSGQRHLGGVK